MPATALTFLIVFLWMVEGLGFARWLMPGLRRHALLTWITGAWLGLLISLIVLVNLYFLIPGVTVNTLAWPVTAILCVVSLALNVWKAPRSAMGFDAPSAFILALSILATLAVLRPLIGQRQLGFYYSNNGDFSNYAAITDIVQYHSSSTHIIDGLVQPRSRESVAGVLGAQVAVLTGQSALWVVQPLAAAFAALAFACLGLLFRHVAIQCGATPWGYALLALIYAWAILSAAAQQFWASSFVSQYLSMALWTGGLLFLTQPRSSQWTSPSTRIVILGLLLGALAFAYAEMFPLNAALLLAFELASAQPTFRARARAAKDFALAAALALIVANRLCYDVLIQRLRFGTFDQVRGWSLFGPHRPLLGFIASLTGLTNYFSGPQVPLFLTAGLVSLAMLAALGHSIARAPKEKDPSLRGLFHLNWIFFALLAVLWVVVLNRRSEPDNNYIVVKFFFGFGWIAFLNLGLLVLSLLHWRPRLLPSLAILLLLVGAGVARASFWFDNYLLRDSKSALFLPSEAAMCRRLMGPNPNVYIGATWFNFAIVGRFIVHDRDLLSVDGSWPDGTHQKFTLGNPGQLILQVTRDYKTENDPKVHGNYQVEWATQCLALLRPVPVVSPPRLRKHDDTMKIPK